MPCKKDKKILWQKTRVDASIKCHQKDVFMVSVTMPFIWFANIK
jgi:hypothetical protein